MFTIGDRNIPLTGLNDEADLFDGAPGSFSVLTNWIANRNYSSLVPRGGLQKEIDLPSVGNGLTTGLSISKILALKKWRVTKPEEKVMTLLVSVCTYTPTDGVPVYMLRFFQNPSYTGSLTALYPAAGSFGTSTSWRDVTPYYIDIVNTNVDIVELGTTKSLDDIGAASNGGYHLQDFVNGYIYLEDPFTSPNNHDAEGDKIVTANSYSVSTNILEVIVESVSSGWARTADTMRLHKNLTTGKIPYLDLCSTSSTFFDTYRFSFETLGEGLLVSCNTGNSTRASWTFKLGYVNRKLFGLGNIWGRADRVYDGVDRLYDRHLVYGFPGYDYVIKAASIFDSQTVDLWDVGVHPTTGAGTYSGTITNGTYNKNRGSFDVGSGFVAATQSPSNRLYRVGRGNPRDISVYLNDFFFQEMDVHGRWGGFRAFGDHATIVANQMYGGSPNDRYNFVGTTAADNADEGVASDEIEWDASASALRFHAIQLAWYDGFRIGMQDETILAIATPSTKILVSPICIPAGFNRFIQSVGTVLSKSYTFADLSTIATTNEVLLNSRLIFYDEMADGWDFYLVQVDNTGAIVSERDFGYVKTFRYDQKKKDSVSIGGNHIVLTGNPGYSRKLSSQDTKQVITLSVDGIYVGPYVGSEGPKHVLVDDFSFGAKYMAALRDRLFMAGVRFQEFQFGSVQSAYFEDNDNVFFSPIAEFGGNYHIFDAATLKVPAKEVGLITGLAAVNLPQGLDQATQPDKNNLLILGESGFKFVDLADNLEENWRQVSYKGDCCVAPKSVISENGFVFCAGNTGVYMFRGYEKVDITILGKSRINKTWRAISRSKKQNAVGVFNRDRGWYVLSIPDDSVFYVFDLRNAGIFG